MLALKQDTNILIDAHGERVELLAAMLCDKLKISFKEKELITISARLHDIGKIVIDKNILNKTSSLNEEEWECMKKHSKFGYIMSRNMGYTESVCESILYHHENYDGTGYYNVKNENIPLGALIIRVCDSYDAIRSKRPYKGERSHEEAIHEMIKTKEKYNESIFKKFLNLNLFKIDKYYLECN